MPPAPRAPPGGGRLRPSRTSRIGNSRRQLQPHRRRHVGPRGQHLRRRRREQDGRQRARRQVRQGRPLHQVVGIARQRAGSVQRHPRHRHRRAGQRVRRGLRKPAHPGVRRRRQREVADHRHRSFRRRCASRPAPHQYLYSSNSNDPETLDNGEIYKLELDGRIVGKFGRAGKLTKEFGMVNSHRLPQRERTARRRADQLARAEGDAEPEIALEAINRSGVKPQRSNNEPSPLRLGARRLQPSVIRTAARRWDPPSSRGAPARSWPPVRTQRSAAATPARTIGSSGLTSNSRLPITRVIATDTPSPQHRAHDRPASCCPPSTSRSVCPASAPSAIRTPSSRVRCVTE